MKSKIYIIETKSASNDWVEKSRFKSSKQGLEAFHELVLDLRSPPDEDDFYKFVQQMVPYSDQDTIEVRLLTAVEHAEGYIPYEILDYQIC